MNRVSTYERFATPEYVRNLILALGATALIAPYAAGLDLGEVKVPPFPDPARAFLTWAGPLAFALTWGGLLRLWPTEARDRALLLGYDAAFALALDLQGKPTRQTVASINTHLKLLELDSIAFPASPAGALRDASPAAQFAQSVAGALGARSTQHEAAFLLGWCGVIETNSPGMAPAGFSVRDQAKRAGFRDSLIMVKDADYLSDVVSRARRRTTP